MMSLVHVLHDPSESTHSLHEHQLLVLAILDPSHIRLESSFQSRDRVQCPVPDDTAKSEYMDLQVIDVVDGVHEVWVEVVLQLSVSCQVRLVQQVQRHDHCCPEVPEPCPIGPQLAPLNQPRVLVKHLALLEVQGLAWFRIRFLHERLISEHWVVKIAFQSEQLLKRVG